MFTQGAIEEGVQQCLTESLKQSLSWPFLSVAETSVQAPLSSWLLARFALRTLAVCLSVSDLPIRLLCAPHHFERLCLKLLLRTFSSFRERGYDIFRIMEF